MKKYPQDVSVGLFVLVGLLCLAWLTVKLGKLEVFSSDGYTVSAQFVSVAGLKSGASVEIAGVPVGRVSEVTLNPVNARALVRLHLKKDIALTDDTIASVKTSGLIGDKYVSLSLGAGAPVPPGGELTETESAVDIESLISKYAFGGVQ